MSLLDSDTDPAPDPQPVASAQSTAATPELGTDFWNRLGLAILILGGLFICGMLLIGGWVSHELRTCYEITDVQPDGIAKNELVVQGWPESIQRIVQARAIFPSFHEGAIFRATIYAFDPRDVPQMKTRISQSMSESRDRHWQPGYGSAGEGLRHFKGRLPADVFLDGTTRPDGFIFFKEDANGGVTHVIDTTRGIYWCVGS